MVAATAIADLIKQRTDSHLRKIQAAVSSKPIVMRAEYAHCPNLTIIDTPGFVLKVQRVRGELETLHASVRVLVSYLMVLCFCCRLREVSQRARRMRSSRW